MSYPNIHIKFIFLVDPRVLEPGTKGFYLLLPKFPWADNLDL